MQGTISATPLRYAWVCRWGPAKSHSDLWREHISDVGVGNLDVVGFADVTVWGLWDVGEEARLRYVEMPCAIIIQ